MLNCFYLDMLFISPHTILNSLFKTVHAQVNIPTYEEIEGFSKFVEKFGERDPTTGKMEIRIGKIISALFPYLFVLAGLGLLVYLILGGFQLMTSRGDPEAVKSAKGKITGALIGFLVIFIAFWLVQILQVVFGLPKIF